MTQCHLKLTMQSGKCMTKRTERSTIVMGETTENMGSSFLKKYKAKNINAIELCQTASVVIYNYFVSCLCCDQENNVCLFMYMEEDVL